MGRSQKVAVRSVKLSPELSGRIDRFRQRLQAKSPGVSISMSDAMRALLEKALAAENGR
jgi:hypothetical protein